jgi:hypothetical protein
MTTVLLRMRLASDTENVVTSFHLDRSNGFAYQT